MKPKFKYLSNCCNAEHITDDHIINSCCSNCFKDCIYIKHEKNHEEKWKDIIETEKTHSNEVQKELKRYETICELSKDYVKSDFFEFIEQLKKMMLLKKRFEDKFKSLNLHDWLNRKFI